MARDGTLELFRGDSPDGLVWLQDLNRREREVRKAEESLRERCYQDVEAWASRLGKREAEDRDERKWRLEKEEQERERREANAMEWVHKWRKEVSEYAAQREEEVRRKEAELKVREEKLYRQIDEEKKALERKRDMINDGFVKREREAREWEQRRRKEMDEREKRKEEELRLKEEELRKMERHLREQTELRSLVLRQCTSRVEPLSTGTSKEEGDLGESAGARGEEEKWQERRRVIESWVAEDCEALRVEFEEKLQSAVWQSQGKRGKSRREWWRSGRGRYSRGHRGRGRGTPGRTLDSPTQ
ncbi:trichohyalin-like [Ischnura elegans]|uniref:trichohyalin-like n=1 Tax=Ischnura elegans TaxID=197161 RepID=UPI001ED8A5BC|nr:trichohyalin-like [Ischnura elegans]